MLGKTETIALEGPVCAGKTTLIKGLLLKDCQIIPEYVDYAHNNNLKLPNFPPKNETEAKSAFEFYLELEKKRQCEIKKGIWLLDRSQYTLLAFEAGARHVTQIDIFQWACKLVEQQKSEVISPNYILYIDVSPEESKRRANLAHMSTPNFLFSPQLNSGFKDAFIFFSTQNPNRFTFIDGCRPYTEVLNDVSQRICSKAGNIPVLTST